MEELAKLRETRHVYFRCLCLCLRNAYLYNLESKIKELTASTETNNNNII